MPLYTSVSDPKAAGPTVIRAVNANGAIVAGSYYNSSGKSVGFVEDVTTGVFSDVSDPYGTGGTVVYAISADGATVAGNYTNSAGNLVGFVERLGVYSDVSVLNGVVTAMSADGTAVAGNYTNAFHLDVGFVERFGSATDISDPHATGGTAITAISADGATVAGYYLNAGNIVGYLEHSGAYTDISDPNGLNNTKINAISADGATVVGYYVTSADIGVGFMEHSGVYSDVTDPNGSFTDVTAISANGATLAGNYIDSFGNLVGFVEDVATGAFTDVRDPKGANGTQIASISADGATVAGYYFDNTGAQVAFVASNLACYARGSSILTERGEVSVEDLAVGEKVITASGGSRPIRWIGHRGLDIARHRDPAAVRPVRVLAGAFGEGRPHRDLWLSPGHNVASEGALMPISALVNGRSIAQIELRHVEYWHVELDAHDVILAEGLPAESYLDTGNRAAFANGGAFAEAHPDFQPKHWKDTCLPLVQEGPAVVATKARLLARLKERGWSIDQEGDAHILVDGVRVEPNPLSKTRLAFALPAGGRQIALFSKTFVPTHTLAGSADVRELGLCVGRLQVDNSRVALEVVASGASGWHEAEFDGARFTHRWTTGATQMPAGVQRVILDLAGAGHYWCETQGALAERAA